jgi:radical SAM protein with 4Fe4S-binding SPASM domain
MQPLFESPAERADRVGREVLWPAPDPGSLAENATLLTWGELPPEQLREKVRDSPEYEEVVRPLLAEIDRVYEQFIFRKPTAQEIVRHLNNFYEKFQTLDDRQKAVRAGNIRPHLGIRPLNLEIDITTQCNLRCIMCPFSEERISKRKREDISVEDFAKIAEQIFPLCSFVCLQSGTEPLLHKQFGELLAITKSYGVPVVGMTTNGLLFNEQKIEEAVEWMDTITISIDAATKPTYERIRRKGNFDRLIANVRALQRAKHRRASQTPVLGFAFVLMRSNTAELPAVVQLAHDMEIPGVIATHLTPFEGLNMEDETLDKDPVLCNRMLDEARTLAEKYHIDICLPANFDQPAAGSSLLQIGVSALTGNCGPSAGNQPNPVGPSVLGLDRGRERAFYIGLDLREHEGKCHCTMPWHYLVIGPYGEVHPCGWWCEKPLGNIRHESFEKIWNNDRSRALRSDHVNGTLGESCRSCPATGMGDVNGEAAFVARKLPPPPEPAVAELQRHARELAKANRVLRRELAEYNEALRRQAREADKKVPYWQLVGRIQEVVRASLPPDATVIVVSRGDEELLKLDGREAWHFPQTEGGLYAGAYPADSQAAIRHLEALRARGGQYLLFPSTALWWLHHYAEFRQHLERLYVEVVCREDTCLILALGGAVET